ENVNNESAFLMSDLDNYLHLFSDSSSLRQLLGYGIKDYGPHIQKLKLSIGGKAVGVHKRGPRKNKNVLYHSADTAAGVEVRQLYEITKNHSNHRAMVRNCQDTLLMNWSDEEVEKYGLLSTLTYNTRQDKFGFRLPPWSEAPQVCPFVIKGKPCDGSHGFEKVPVEISSFLAEQRIAKKKLGRKLKGVNDHFAEWLNYVYSHFRPVNWK
ncbi:33699_t:CDS:1, partial [Racocetra persica]